MRPLTVEPITIPNSCDRTSGVNQAVSPSRIPRAPPTTSATPMRFIVALLVRAGASGDALSLPGAGNPLTVREQQDQSASDQIGGEDAGGDAMARHDAKGLSQ